MTAGELARQLQAKRSGAGWIAKCPAHDDRTASLSIGEGENDCLLLKCHAGCTFDQIIKAAGVEPTRSNGVSRNKTEIVAAYDYRDPRGELVFQIVRKRPKSFVQRRPDGNGGWIWGRGNTLDLPYRLPELLDASEIFIVEGEKDCDALAAIGLVATTNPAGATKWPESFGRYFYGRHAILIPDNDELGRAHVRDVARKLTDHAASIRVLELPDLPPKGDFSDWLAAGGTRDQLDELAAMAPEWQDKPDDIESDGRMPGLDIVWANNIQLDLDKPGLVDGLLSSTAMTVAYGESGAGKTFVVIDLACCIGAAMFWRGHATEQGVVVYIATEAPKSVERRVWAWMRHHSVTRLPLAIVRSSVNLLDGDTDTLLVDLAQIQAEQGHIALVVVDTLARAMIGNENSPEDLGAFVTACTRIREAAETSVLIVHHCGKDQARGARGHSCLRAATDVELEITEGRIKVSKNRDGQEGQIYGFALTEVELGVNAKGRMVTTCVAEESDPPVGEGKKRPLGPNEQLVLDALVKAIADEPDPPPATAPSHARGCSVTRWQNTALLLLPQPEEFRKREAFNRALPSLVAKSRVHHVAGFAWLP
jgi:hypothetical protein